MALDDSTVEAYRTVRKVDQAPGKITAKWGDMQGTGETRRALANQARARRPDRDPPF